MAFPTGTVFDQYEPAINWLREKLSNATRYPLLNQYTLTKLEQELANNCAGWVTRSLGYLLPSMVLSVDRWRDHGHEPLALLDRLERGLAFNQGNAQEVGNLTGNFWDPQMSSTTVMQLMVTASLMDRARPGLLHPVAGNRPDLSITPHGRSVGIEVTARNYLQDIRTLEGDWIDWQRAEEDFNHLWRARIQPKQQDYDCSAPIVLVVWDCNQYGEVHHFVTEPEPGGVVRSFCDLLHIHEPDCTPFSAIVYLPYVKEPHVTLCDGLTHGKRLTDNEAGMLRDLFSVNPAVENGFLPPEAM